MAKTENKNEPVRHSISADGLINFSASRLWLTDGALMVHDRGVCLLSWLFNIALYMILCGFYNRIMTGQFWVTGVNAEIRYIIPNFLSPINIFEFPAYILLFAAILAMIVAIPMLVSQLYNLFYALPLVLVGLLLCHDLPMSLSIFFACAAVSFDPLRFKSKFVSAVLCMAPVVFYWAVFAGPNPWQDSDALRWAIAYSPLAFAYLNCILLFGITLLIGHFTRYKPFLIVPIFFVVLAVTIWQFCDHVGIYERDFRAEVVSFSPKNMAEFQDRSIVPLIEKERAAIKQEQPYLSDDAINSKIEFRWRWAFALEPTNVTPDSEAARVRINIASAKERAIDSFKGFIEKHQNSKRLAEVLYYRALTIDMIVDQRALRFEDTLRFTSKYTSEESEFLWRAIKENYPNSIFAIEARLRLAHLLAGKKPINVTGTYNFDQAIMLLKDNLEICKAKIEQMKAENGKDQLISEIDGIFAKPEPAITLAEAEKLQTRIEQLISLLSIENRAGNLRHEKRLADFIMLNPSQLRYEDKLKELLLDSPKPDPLLDNIELEIARITQNIDNKDIKLMNIVKEYPDTDGGVAAMVELADLLIKKVSRTDKPGEKDVYSKQAADLLNNVITSRPDSYLARQAKTMLNSLNNNSK